MNKTTEQEKVWKGNFGDSYTSRTSVNTKKQVASNISLFNHAIKNVSNLSSIIEFGCNFGLNLHALRELLPESKITGIEINDSSADIVDAWGGAEVIRGSISDVIIDKKFDMSFTKGVLIHIHPDKLKKVYEQLYSCSNKYILIAEYYNPTPMGIPYRGHKNRLFKRDFAGEIMGIYPDLTLIDYGFVYHNDILFPQDDINWFLMKK